MAHVAEQKISRRAMELQAWIEENGQDCQKTQGHLVDGIERIYWHYGYMVALMDVLRLITKTHVQQN